METYPWHHGQRCTAKKFGVSRHTVWRFLYRDNVGRRLPHTVVDAFGGDLVALISATWKLNSTDPGRTFVSVRTSLPVQLKETLLLV